MNLTKRQREVLRLMAENAENEDGELVYERGLAYLGTERIAARTVFALLRLMAIRLMTGSTIGCCERYTINETGRALAEALEVDDAR